MSSNKSELSQVDPWLNTVVDESSQQLEFEDKFQPKKSIVPLDDSEHYLATLERKLAKLRAGQKDRKRELLRAIEDTHDSYMRRVISSESREALNINQDTDLEEPVTPKLIHSWINPEQAVTVGELAELLRNDSLSATPSEHEHSDTSS